MSKQNDDKNLIGDDFDIDRFFAEIKDEKHNAQKGVNDVDTSNFLNDLEELTGRNFSKGKNGSGEKSLKLEKNEKSEKNDAYSSNLPVNKIKSDPKAETDEGKSDSPHKGSEEKHQLSTEPYERIHSVHRSDYKDMDKYAEPHDEKKHTHSSKKKRFSRAQRAVIIILLIILFLILSIIAAYLIFNTIGKSQIKGTVNVNYGSDIVEYNGNKYKYNDDVISIAFMGIDQESFGTPQISNGTAGQSDVNMVIAFNTKTGKTDIIALPRDSIVDVDRYTLKGEFSDTVKTQLCLAYSYGDGAESSCENTIKSMSRILYGVPIRSYAALDISGISEINDAVGGVTITSLQTFGDTFYKGETYTLRGELAEQYIRSRGDTLDSDAQRRERQIQYIKAFVTQVIQQSRQDFGTVTALYNAGKDYMQSNIGISQITYLGTTFLTHNVDLTSFDNVRTLKGTLKKDKAGYAATYLDEEDVLKTVIDIYYESVS